MSKLSLYLASPMFSQAERQFNREVRDCLSRSFRVFLPQESGVIMSDLLCRGVSPQDAIQKVFAQDLMAIQECDALVIVLDGRSVDEGAAFELGLGYALKKVCVGLQTDLRRLAPFGNNPMIDGALEKVFKRVDEVLRWLERRFAPRIGTSEIHSF